MPPWLTFAELRQRLEDDFGCRYIEDGQVPGSGAPVGWLERNVGGAVRRYAVTYGADFRLAPSVIRSICAQLRVDPAEFG